MSVSPSQLPAPPFIPSNRGLPASPLVSIISYEGKSIKQKKLYKLSFKDKKEEDIFCEKHQLNSGVLREILKNISDSGIIFEELVKIC